MKTKISVLILILIASIVTVGTYGFSLMNQNNKRNAVVLEESVVIKQGSVGKKPVVTLEYLINSYFFCYYII